MEAGCANVPPAADMVVHDAFPTPLPPASVPDVARQCDKPFANISESEPKRIRLDAELLSEKDPNGVPTPMDVCADGSTSRSASETATAAAAAAAAAAVSLALVSTTATAATTTTTTPVSSSPPTPFSADAPSLLTAAAALLVTAPAQVKIESDSVELPPDDHTAPAPATPTLPSTGRRSSRTPTLTKPTNASATAPTTGKTTSRRSSGAGKTASRAKLSSKSAVGNTASSNGVGSSPAGRKASSRSAPTLPLPPVSLTIPLAPDTPIEEPALLPGFMRAADFDGGRLVSVFGETWHSYVLVEEHSGGGARVLHMYPPMALLSTHLAALPAEFTEQEVEGALSPWNTFGEAFFDESMREDAQGNALYVMGIVHGGALVVPNVLRHLSARHGSVEALHEVLVQPKLALTNTLERFVADIDASLDRGTHKAGSLRPISLVGRMQEERGGYFEEVLKMLERNPFARASLPWGPLATLKGTLPKDSDDGPILWSRPGEQMLSTNDLQWIAERSNSQQQQQQQQHQQQQNQHKSPSPRKRPRELSSLLGRSRGGERSREKHIIDRTPCHADHAGLPPFRVSIAAVGVLQPPSDTRNDRRVVKDVIAFAASEMARLAQVLGLDYNEEPQDQCIYPETWVEDAKLNQLGRLGVPWARITLRHHDMYYIPRKIVHQFKTVAASTSVTWHVKYVGYYPNAQDALDSEAVDQSQGQVE